MKTFLDGHCELDFQPGLFPVTRETISRLLSELARTEGPRGRPLEYLHWVPYALEAALGRHGVDLAPARKWEILDDLLAPVHERHRQKDRISHKDLVMRFERSRKNRSEGV